MPKRLQEDPPAVLRAWWLQYGDNALKELTYQSGISPPTLRKVLRSQPIRGEVALKLAGLLHADAAERLRIIEVLKNPPPAVARKVARKRRRRNAAA